MTRRPNFDKNGNKKGAWSEEEDTKLKAYIERYGHWNWREIPRFAGVSRCGKSCRLRWMNYLRPNMKHGNFSKEEEDTIIKLHSEIGNKWSAIAEKLPGRSDNEIKNYWNTNLRKRAKKDQLYHKDTLIGNINVESLLSTSSNIGSPIVNTHGQTCVTQSSSATSTPSLLSSSSLSDFDGSVSYSIQSFDSIKAGNFWTDPLFTDMDNVTTDEIFSYMDLAQATSSDFLMDDEFLWSTINLYDGYHKQLQK